MMIFYFSMSDRAQRLAADKNPPKKYVETITSLMSFVNNIESVLLSEHAVMSDEKTMRNRVERFEEFRKSLQDHSNDFDYVNKVGQDLIAKTSDEALSQRIREELQDLNTKWSDLPIILDERLQKLYADIETASIFDAEVG